MENQNPPNLNQSGSSIPSFPPLPKRDHSQILTDPEHILGKLSLPKIRDNPKKTTPAGKVPIIISLFLVIFFVVALTAFFIPRTNTFKFAVESIEAVTSLSKNIDGVNTSLEILYQARSNPEQSDVNVSRKDVLGSKTTSQDLTIFIEASSTAKKIKDVFDKASSVKAFSVPAGDPTVLIRKHRELATEIAEKVADAKDSLSKIRSLKNRALGSTTDTLLEKLDSLEGSTNKYIDQSQKTSDYYVDISEASIDLYNLAAATNTVKDVDSGIFKLGSLESKFSGYKALPDQMGAYNKDLVEMFDLLGLYFGDLKSILKGESVDMTKKYALFLLELKSISARAVNDEVSFWQNNKSLSNYDTLVKEHSEVIALSEKLKTSNNFFLVDWIGMK